MTNQQNNESSEFVVRERLAANLFRGKEGVGGRLNITNRRLSFNPHAFNLQTQPEEIMIEDIVRIDKGKSWGFIPNIMLITTKNGNVYKFVVYKRDKLIELISSYMS
ncbi:hypothetical protein JCM10914A_50930 [Paenibacillus sp. JCM 10914]|uniref:GRAM domain-containing protein n=1 Tax=Paenibacillus sp. JCM 10914 TaxID=1236974 RepID=UPI0003CCA7EB|nr:GRAM domain-containing protein [Paenibacillus sp. JCM 10914]GAE05208.1 hypothetical protein JCM10914_1300 [Paenibacillus sp. JCM 10914]